MTTTLTATSTDTRYWVTRHGQPVKLRWNELTATEREEQRKAEERAAYTTMFAIY